MAHLFVPAYDADAWLCHACIQSERLTAVEVLSGPALLVGVRSCNGCGKQHGRGQIFKVRIRRIAPEPALS